MALRVLFRPILSGLVRPAASFPKRNFSDNAEKKKTEENVTEESQEEPEQVETPEKDETLGSGKEPVGDVEQKLNAAMEDKDKLKDQLLRALAEMGNVRSRAVQDVENARKFALKEFAKSLLDVTDTLSRATEAIPEEARKSNTQLAQMHEGVALTEKMLLQVLKKNGIIKIWPVGEKFDPNLHSAMVEIPTPGAEPGTVCQVFKAGYTYHERCLRPAEVGVVPRAQAPPPPPCE